MGFLEFYKKGQGSMGRLIALLGCIGLVLWGGHSLWTYLQGYAALTKAILPIPHTGLQIDWALIIAVIVAFGGIAGVAWFFNRPKMVDLLVETEAEMKKISWPSRQEAWNSAVIVVVTVVVLMSQLCVYEFVLNHVVKQLFGA